MLYNFFFYVNILLKQILQHFFYVKLLNFEKVKKICYNNENVGVMKGILFIFYLILRLPIELFRLSYVLRCF
jgi:hypothetical protein